MKTKFSLPLYFKDCLYDSARQTANLGVDIIKVDEILFFEMIRLSVDAPYPYSMRASRIIQLCCELYPHMLLPYIEEIVLIIINTTVGGVRRNYLKIFSEHIDIYKLQDIGLIVAKCFEWLSSVSEPIAVMCYCMDILYKVSMKETDIQNELDTLLELHLKYGSAAFRNKALKILGIKNH